MNLDTLIDKIALSKEKQVSLLIFCFIIILISLSDYIMDLLKIKELVLNVLPSVFILTIFLIGTLIGKPIYDYFKNKYTGYITKQNMQGFLKQLTNDEKELLQKYLTENKRTQYIDISDGVVNGLVAKKLVYRASSVGGYMTSFAYNIQDIAFNILKENPKYLKINDIEKES